MLFGYKPILKVRLNAGAKFMISNPNKNIAKGGQVSNCSLLLAHIIDYGITNSV